MVLYTINTIESRSVLRLTCIPYIHIYLNAMLSSVHQNLIIFYINGIFTLKDKRSDI